MMCVRRQVKVIDGDVTALTDVFKGDGPSNARRTTGDGGGFRGEEVVRHDDVNMICAVWRSRKHSVVGLLAEKMDGPT